MRMVLKLENVTKHFTKEKVLNNISLKVEEGKIVGLVEGMGQVKVYYLK